MGETKQTMVATITPTKPMLQANLVEAKPETLHGLYIEVAIDNIGVTSLIDTGAQATLLSAIGYWTHFAKYPLQKVNVTFTGYSDGMTSHTLGKLEAPTTVAGVTKMINMYVMDNLQAPLLFGDDALKTFGLKLDYENMQVSLGKQQIPTYSKPMARTTLVPVSGRKEARTVNMETV